MDLELKPSLPEFLEDEEAEPEDKPEKKPENTSEELPAAFQPDEPPHSIKVLGGDNFMDLVSKAGHSEALRFLVRMCPYSFLGDHLLVAYLEFSALYDFKKLGTTYKTEDPELFAHWLTLEEFGGPGKPKKLKKKK
jgi:hypothetical protein